jgi:hypothetical protein
LWDQAALGESAASSKGKDERVLLKLAVDGSEFAIATLCAGKCDQIALDLILDREFSVSHDGAGSVYLTGYKTEAVRDVYPSRSVSPWFFAFLRRSADRIRCSWKSMVILNRLLLH